MQPTNVRDDDQIKFRKTMIGAVRNGSATVNDVVRRGCAHLLNKLLGSDEAFENVKRRP